LALRDLEVFSKKQQQQREHDRELQEAAMGEHELRRYILFY
jgi:hypothetical protein